MNTSSPAEAISSLYYDVLEASAMLLYLLSSAAQNRPECYVQPGVTRGLQLPGLSLCCLPCITGVPDDELYGLNGAASQMAYKGWIAEVFARWESHNRNELQTAIRADIQAEDTIRPQADAFGYLRHIRNDLLHNNGIASMDSGRKWFRSGDRMVFGIRHVFDFLNHVGALSFSHVSSTTYRGCSFSIPHGRAGVLLKWKPKPRLISVRTHETNAAETNLHKRITAVFNNGLHV